MSKKARPEPGKVSIYIWGPCHPVYGRETDYAEREVVIHIDVSHGSSLTKQRLVLKAYRRKSLSTGIWQDVFSRYPEVGDLPPTMDQYQAEGIVKLLRQYAMYCKRLPIPPRSLADHLSCIMGMLNIHEADNVYLSSDHFTEFDKEAYRQMWGVSHLSHEVDRREQELRQDKEGLK